MADEWQERVGRQFFQEAGQRKARRNEVVVQDGEVERAVLRNSTLFIG